MVSRGYTLLTYLIMTLTVFDLGSPINFFTGRMNLEAGAAVYVFGEIDNFPGDVFN